jgi:hypothetical protein
MWATGSGRSTSFSDWECRRNEIRAQIENYEIGTTPTRPQSITASYAAGVLTVDVTVNGLGRLPCRSRGGDVPCFKKERRRYVKAK